jgi:hypothetical protein
MTNGYSRRFSLPKFIVPMAIWFFVVNLGLTAVVQFAVDTFGSSSSQPSIFRNASLLIPFLVGGYWSGWFFQRKAGRASTWTEAWTSGALLASIFVATIWLSGFAFRLTGIEIGIGKRAWATGPFAGLFYSLFLYPIAWFVLSSTLHSSSKAFRAKA